MLRLVASGALVMGLALAGIGCSPAPAPAPTEPPAPTATPVPSTAVPPTAVPTAPPTATVPPTAVPTLPPTPPPTAPPTPVPTVAPTTAAATSGAAASGPAVTRDDVRQVAEAWSVARSYHMVGQLPAAGGQPATTIDVQVVKPDRQHVRVTVGSQTIELIRVGNDSYTNLAGLWTRAPAEALSPLDALTNPDDMVAGFDEQAQSGVSYTKGSTETVDGVPCQQWVRSGPGGGSGEVDSVCIGTADHLPRQFQGTTDGRPISVTFTDWNAPITIEPPV
jgi:hypothetical protein